MVYPAGPNAIAAAVQWIVRVVSRSLATAIAIVASIAIVAIASGLLMLFEAYRREARNTSRSRLLHRVRCFIHRDRDHAVVQWFGGPGKRDPSPAALSAKLGRCRRS